MLQIRRWKTWRIDYIAKLEFFLARMTYLGLRVGENMSLINSWNPVVEVFEKQLSQWKVSRLSMGGRLVLINSVLDALPIYYFSLYKAPIQVIEKLERIRRQFFMGKHLRKEEDSLGQMGSSVGG